MTISLAQDALGLTSGNVYRYQYLIKEWHSCCLYQRYRRHNADATSRLQNNPALTCHAGDKIYKQRNEIKVNSYAKQPL